jgi:hypothetical protein
MRGRKMWLKLAMMVAVVAVFVPAAEAGPELICFPHDIGGAKSLPWGGSGWHAARSDYDTARLAADTLALLGSDVPVIVRMETLRRAAIYARRNARAGQELLAQLEARARAAMMDTNADPLPAFDYGYFLEAHRQAFYIRANGEGFEHRGTPPAALPRGYNWIVKALARRGNDPQMEYAAALVARLVQNREALARHSERAVTGASADPLLARNLVRNGELLALRGNTLAEIRASLAAARN